MKDYYVYTFHDPRDGIQRYIGKGKGRRKNNWWRGYGGEQYGVDPWLRKLRSLGLKPVVSILATGLTEPEALALEVKLIAEIGRQSEDTGPLLNLSPGGASGFSGCHHCITAIQKMSKARKGKPHSEQWCRNISKSKKGQPLSDLNRKGLIGAQTGRKHSEKTKAKIAKANKGRKHSEKTKAKIAKANKGRKHSDKSRQNMSDAHKSKKAV